MPNWASSKVTITGDMDTVKEIKNRLAKPYQDPHDPERTNEGVFLLWNIVNPTNMKAYTGEEQKAFDEIIKADPELAELNKFEIPAEMSDVMSRVIHEMATSDSWYEWNCRNWGTKWETGEKAEIDYEMPYTNTTFMGESEKILEICYRMDTAWSPPAEALARLAEQYPNIKIDLASIDESDCFAYEAQWLDGILFHEEEPEITHQMGIELRGYCNLRCCNR